MSLTALLAVSACTSGGGAGDAAPSPSHSGAFAPSAAATPSVSSPPSEAVPPGEPAGGTAPRGWKVRRTFFGMHDGRVAEGTAPGVRVGALRLWDDGTSWRQLETSPGQFAWGPLDTAVATAEAVGARPLLVLGQTPAFHASRPGQEAAYGPGAASAPDSGAWRRYVTAVARRYGDRIDYQVWDEADVVGYWSGTSREMAELTVAAGRAIRRAVPQATVVAPSFALRLPEQRRSFAQFWSLQSREIDLASAVDAVAVHLYPPAEDPPETQVRLLEHAREVLARHDVRLPVWNTEINFGLLGGPEPPRIPAERQRAYLMRTYLLNAGLGVRRVYWYRWDLIPIANTLLTTPDFSAPTLAGRAFPTIRAWLDGTRFRECEPSAGVWQCTARAGPQVRTFWWKPQGPPRRFRAGQAARSWTDADETVTRCRGGCEVPVGETPVMVTSRAGG